MTTRTRARLARALAVAALIATTLASLPAGAGGRAPSARRMDAVARRLLEVQEASASDYLQGNPAAALARLQSVVGGDDWEALLALGNMTWVMHPAQALQWHEQAYERSRGNDHVLLELAYHYTRRGECAKATDAWARLDRAGLLGSYMPLLASYCHLRLGQDREAFAMLDRAAPGRHGQFERVLGELWGRRPALGEHADHLQALRATGDPASLAAGLENALRFGRGSQRGAALLALADAARPFADRLGSVSAQLDCLSPAFAEEARPEPRGASDDDDDFDYAAWQAESEARERHQAGVKAAWARQMDQCALLTGSHPLPDHPALARLLVANAMALDIAPAADLLAAHGPALDARARSAAGDLEALRILAALQSAAQDPGLVRTDDLGWSRYADPKFATSRVVGQLLKDGQPTPDAIALLERAHAQFPQDQRLLELWLRHGHPAPDAARRGWRELALMEFHNPSASGLFHAGPSAATLYMALRKYREAAAP